ncbi:MAG: GapR family DNA-binding domain-containing protein, partial [Pseudomonadota bacterium]
MSADAADMLQSYVDRTLRLRDERRLISSDIREVAKEAAHYGFDKKAFNQVVQRAEKDRTEVVEQDMIVS